MRIEELKALCNKYPISIPIVLPVCREDVPSPLVGSLRVPSEQDSKFRRWRSSVG